MTREDRIDTMERLRELDKRLHTETITDDEYQELLNLEGELEADELTDLNYYR